MLEADHIKAQNVVTDKILGKLGSDGKRNEGVLLHDYSDSKSHG